MQITQSTNKIALLIAAVSFIIGTLLLLAHFFSGWNPIIIVGVFYVMIAFVLNTITLIGLIGNAIINYQYNKENIKTIGIFLLNIPIAISYIFIVINYPFYS